MMKKEKVDVFKWRPHYLKYNIKAHSSEKMICKVDELGITVFQHW